jgi:hypothetical protein
MNKNEPSKTDSMSTTSSLSDNRSHAFEKAQRYLGLFTVLALAYLLFSPWSSGRALKYESHPRYYVLNEHYHHKTTLSELVLALNNIHAWEVSVAGDYIRDCEKAKTSVFYGKGKMTEDEMSINIELLPVAEKKEAIQVILDGCTSPSLQSTVRAAQIEPDFWPLYNKLNELRDKARKEQGLARDHQPKPTPEMLSISYRLEELRKRIAKASAEWLVLINGLVHIVSVILIGLGLWFRGLVGRILLTPFGWLLSGIKNAHERV